MGVCSPAFAQFPSADRYYPLDHTVRPGVVGQWNESIHNVRVQRGPVFQPIRVEMPVEADVTIYDGPSRRPIELGTPAQATLMVGPVYRLKISNLKDLPGVELYPSVELIDRLHPPPGRSAAYPVPIGFTEQELQFAMDGRLVTKVVYLEQPNRAYSASTAEATTPRLAMRGENALQLADERGRPMAIVRLGGRLPDIHDREADFFGMGAPVRAAVSRAAREVSRGQSTVSRSLLEE